MNSSSSPDPIESVSNRGQLQCITPVSASGSNSALNLNIQRYSRSTLYLLRNDVRSRRRPECALRADLMALGVWRINGGSGSYQQNGNGNEAGATSTNNSNSNLNSGALPTYTRGQRSPSTRAILSSTEHTPSTQYVSHPNQKNYIDHRTISSAHLMPAFAKRRIGMPPQMAASSYAPNTSSGPRPETPSDSGQSVKDFPYTSRQKGKDQLQERQHGDDSQSSVAYLSPQRKNMGDYDRERNEGNHSTSASPATSSGPSNTRHNIGNTPNERRIGSGRLLHCDVNWEYRSVDKDNNRTSNLSDKEALFSNHPQQQSRTSATFTERGERSNFIERRSFDRRNTDLESRDKFENRNSNSHSSGGSSRRFISKDMESNSSSVQISEQHPVTHNRSRRHHYNERNDEPEWFSGGPTSQHDTIELRGFDEPDEQFGGANKSLPRKLSESSSSRASSNINLSHKKPKDMQHTAKEQTDKDNDSDEKVLMFKSSATNTKCSTNNTDQQAEVLEINDKNKSSGEKDTSNSNEKTKDSKIELGTNNAQFGLTEFNFDAFLNMDPLTHSLMGTDVKPDEDLGTIGSSRFSRWFGNKNSQLDIGNHSASNMISDESGDNMTMEIHQHSPNPSESPIMKQSNKLMQFLQRGKLPAALLECTQPHVCGIPSVEELESRMRKIRLAKESTSSNEDHQQAKLFNKPNIREIGKLPEQSTTSQTPTIVPTTPQDTEAFKKLLEQLGSANKLDSPLQSNINICGVQQQYNQETENAHSAFIVVQQQQKHHGIAQNILPSHVSNNEEISKFIQQQQFIHQQQRMLQQSQQNALQHAQSDSAFTPTYVPTSVVPEKSRNEAINSLQGMPSPREVHFHSQAMMQNAIMKKKLEEHENFRRRQELQKHQKLPNPTMPGTQQHPLEKELNQKTLHQHQLQAGLSMQHPSPQNLQNSPQQHQQTHQTHHSHLIQHQQRQINSPTPLAFTPTSVLRKMTAEKDNSTSVTNTQHQQAANQIHTQQQRQPQNHQQMSNKNLQSAILNQQLLQQQSQVINSNVGPQPQQPAQQPRMILGGGNHPQQQAQLGGGGQLLTQQQSLQQQHPSIHGPQQAQRLRSNQQQQLKWPVPPALSQQQIPINKPIGRPILKGPLPTAQSQQQKLQQQQMSPMSFASKIEMQQIQQQQKLKINPALQHMQQQPFSMSQQQQQTKTNIMTQVQQHLFQQQQQQRAAAMQRAQHIQLQHIHQQQQHLNRSTAGTIASNQQQSAAGGSTTSGNPSGIMNYQRDGGLSPTSNQLAQWFSPELLAQASAGKLPLLNMNQALSLEEFERSIQHSSTAVHN